jgi:hypothetical protein
VFVERQGRAHGRRHAHVIRADLNNPGRPGEGVIIADGILGRAECKASIRLLIRYSY